MPRPWSGRTRVLTVALAWVAAVGAATVVGMTAVDAIGSGIVGAGQEPLSQSEVNARLSAFPTTTSTTTPTPAPPSTSDSLPAVEATVVNSRGGSVIARCAGGLVEVVSTTPAQGYQTRAESGGDHPSIRFTAGRARVEVRLRCVNGIPRAEIKDD